MPNQDVAYTANGAPLKRPVQVAVQRRTVAELAWRLSVDVFVRFGIHRICRGNYSTAIE